MSDSSIILVAEDNDFVRMQIVKHLQEEGHHLLEASDGREAIHVAEKEQLDLAIVDVRMEPLSGFDFIRALRGMEVDIPVILVTGDNAPDILEKSGDWNVSAVLIKPVEKERLLKAVERALGQRHKRAMS